ncbi:hypothetical protein FRAAL2573 [Frankia alni ACN14a]|uniref:Uncharacterized protein n=1 Tax=Frankia alni (strain DSM 45986 / CECT 9034 / ACN14a) TaxID=326424 RepID=Q0RMM7_FRAAA|nr:hypothetical protein FRAAL2573 [Frankia alni ACN14a]
MRLVRRTTASWIARGLAWRKGQLTAADVGRRLGLPVSESELVGWVSKWPVSVRGHAGESVLSALPATQPAELMISIAEWLQDVIADGGTSDPVPPCPGHRHSTRPQIHQEQAWWVCPVDGPIRPWQVFTE